ncbi:hypothetical protein LINGRAHAP2_LOCUS34096 [Linum grandiflorum]
MEANKQRKSLDDDDREIESSIKSNTSSTNSSPRRPATPSSPSSSDEEEHPTKTTTTTATTSIDGYDPKRIPSSIFASKSGKGIDWSVASNESLFSIHMGNNSFSRDQIAMLYKSGELPMLVDQEYSNGQPPTSSTWQQHQLPPPSPHRRNNNNININNNPPPPINIVHVHVHVPTTNNNNVVAATAAATTVPPQVVAAATAAAVNNTPAITRDSSGSSTKSFQFPILQHEQMGRNNTTQKVEAGEQRSEKKTAEEDEMTRQATEQQKTENQQADTSGSWTNCFGRSWLGCLPCFQKPANTTSSSS